MDVDDDEEADSQSGAVAIIPQESGNLSLRRVDIESSPILEVQCGSTTVPVVIDSGAESSLIEEEYALSTGATILKTTTKAHQADGQSSLEIVGEVHMEFKRYPHTFKFNGLVARKLKDKVIAGMPFLSTNDIYIRPSQKTIHIGDKEVIYYGTPRRKGATNTSRRTTAVILRIPEQTTLLPGDKMNIPVPAGCHLEKDEFIAVEPRVDSHSLKSEKFGNMWLKPHIAVPTNGLISLCNNTSEPILLKKHEQVGNLRPVVPADEGNTSTVAQSTASHQPSKTLLSETTDYLNVVVDPDGALSDTMKAKFRDLHKEYKSVFDSRTLGCYNGASGPLEVKINMGPTLPPQRKGKMPLYNRSLQEEQQVICDDLEGTVFAKPEDLGITVEYLNPSFLVRKPSGKKRLVTAFGEVGQYSKPQPALLPNVDQTLRTISQWEYILIADLTSAYWQMLLARASMKYCGIVTPFKGVRVYQRGAMGMPGTETALEEMMCRILGDLIAEGSVAKLADDLYVGGSSPEIVLSVWRKVLDALSKNGLRLSAPKTLCCPKSATILGWLWNCGTLQASPHRLSALEAADLPSTVGQLRSYIGSFKFLSRVISAYSDVLSPLDEIAAGRPSSEKIAWNDSLMNAFRRSQKQLASAKIITLPRRNDQLRIITDASLSKSGIAATLYVIREEKTHVAGFFNAKLRQHQVRWLPCEVEALCISAAVSHFGADIIDSNHQAMVLTDSLPCVMAYDKLCRGEFSSSARVSTFLSNVSRFHVKVSHIKGSSNVVSDFASRNPLQCLDSRCQVCKFVAEVEDSVVRSCSVNDVLNSKCPIPYSTRSGWHEMQQACKHVRRASAHLRQGTTPSKKATNIRDVKRYLQVARVAKDGLLVVESFSPFRGARELIVVPRDYLHALLVSLHLKLDHPTKSQLKKVFSRAFYALDLDQAIEILMEGCHMCASLQNMHTRFLEQSTSCPSFIGSHYNADVLRRACQCILVVRENVSSFTFAQIISDEKAATLKHSLLILLSDLLAGGGPGISVRADPGSGWRSLETDDELKSKGIQLQLGYEKFKNKNSIVDKAITELRSEINRLHQSSSGITDTVLAQAVANLNSRIRAPGLSAREMWLQRDQYTGQQLPIDDLMLIQKKYADRLKSHAASAKFQARGKVDPVYPDVQIGDIVYINAERDKTKPRDRYVVIDSASSPRAPNTVRLQKFVGSQLRARVYTVNRGDIIQVKAFRFPPVHEDSSSSDDCVSDTEASHKEDVGVMVSDKEDEVHDDVHVVVEEPANNANRRPSRVRKLPPHLSDYVLTTNDEDDEVYEDHPVDRPRRRSARQRQRL